jgi:hypothetical protein
MAGARDLMNAMRQAWALDMDLVKGIKIMKAILGFRTLLRASRCFPAWLILMEAMFLRNVARI